MASYQIKWRQSTRRDLRKISKEALPRIVAAIESLGEEPRPNGSMKLAGSDLAYRIRVGDYRIIYEIFEETVLIEIVRVGHRKDVYRRR
ncbi:type II toxin-antitoxin system RelE family toxin [Roseibacillus persicicus]|uniref:Type II toxin-antitoxin system mRNA interferase toxin, RelE/StbE family n=1 Tax=Roseibacillus persicicus TaxID=454148 RepID=A0A918TVQ5_9BACT|nr:hypothetical protein GCM10007100_36420 [Roseibacillus persicicus]